MHHPELPQLVETINKGWLGLVGLVRLLPPDLAPKFANTIIELLENVTLYNNKLAQIIQTNLDDSSLLIKLLDFDLHVTRRELQDLKNS